MTTDPNDTDDFAADEWDRLLAEGEASIAASGTVDGETMFAARRARRAARTAADAPRERPTEGGNGGKTVPAE